MPESKLPQLLKDLSHSKPLSREVFSWLLQFGLLMRVCVCPQQVLLPRTQHWRQLEFLLRSQHWLQLYFLLRSQCQQACSEIWTQSPPGATLVTDPLSPSLNFRSTLTHSAKDLIIACDLETLQTSSIPSVDTNILSYLPTLPLQWVEKKWLLKAHSNLSVTTTQLIHVWKLSLIPQLETASSEVFISYS